MRLFSKAPDGGRNSGVTGYFVVEIKSLFTVVILRFAQGTREAYHSHSFNAYTLWLSGSVKEHHRADSPKFWKAGQWKFTARDTFHKVEALGATWCISFRGPWVKTWQEDRQGHVVTLTHGRRIVT